MEATVTVEHAVEVLNRALDADPDAISELIFTRVPCNDALADDPTIQVGAREHKGAPVPGTTEVGILGIINGIFGVHPGTGYGRIAVDADRKRKVVNRFLVTRPPAEVEPGMHGADG